MANVQPLKAMNLDPNQIQMFIRYYRSMPSKSASTVRLFHHGEFYSLHEDDATLAAEIVFHNNIVKYMGGEAKMRYLCLSQNNFESLISELLLVRQYRVEVYVKVNAARVNEWRLDYNASPGNLTQFETLLFENAGASAVVASSSVMGVTLDAGNHVGVACVNTIEGEIAVMQFVDNEFFSELEAVIACVNPKECVMPEGGSNLLRALRTVLERNDVLVATGKKEDYDDSKLDSELNRLLFFAANQQRNVQVFGERKLTSAMCACRAVIKYLNLMADKQHYNQYRLCAFEGRRFMRMDNAAMKALHILPKPGTNANPYDSLFGVLNSCKTPQGKRLLLRWMKQPLRDINILNDRLDAVEALIEDSDARIQLTSSSLQFVDLLLLAKRMGSKKANLHDCYKVYQAVNSVPFLLQALESVHNAAVNSLIIVPIREFSNDLDKYQRMIEETVDLDLAQRDEYFVRPSYDSSLDELYQQRVGLEMRMQKVHQRVAGDLNKAIKLECNDQHGYFFRVSLKDEHTMRKNKTYRVLDSIKSGVRFTNDELAELNDEYVEVKRAYETQQRNVVEEIVDVAAGYSDAVKHLNAAIATADVLVSFAVAAVNAPIPYVRPKLLPMGAGVLRLRAARHPCLECLDKNFISNDVLFAKDECTFRIVTGPNMGGKSTYIRTAGICVYLAHLGSFVPCDSAEITIVDSILTRVGAGDCEEKGLSTFMMEMSDTRGIIRNATANSLVIIDELGRGTSTYDGCGIAWAVAHHFAIDIKAFTLFATHYQEITQLANETPMVENCYVSMIIANGKITPLYAIKKGICERSYGIQCAEVANFPEDVIKASKEYLKELECTAGLMKMKGLDPEIQQNTIDRGDEVLAETFGPLREQFQSGALDKNFLAKELQRIKAQLVNSDNLFIQGLLADN